MVVIGLDISSTNTGYCIMESTGDKLSIIKYGNLIPSKKYSQTEKILFMHNEVDDIINKYKPTVMIAEDQHYGRNVKTLKFLSRVAGGIVLLSAQNKMELVEYSPKEIKKALFGDGKASKEDMVQSARDKFKISDPLLDDNAADAIGAAYTYFHMKNQGE